MGGVGKPNPCRFRRKTVPAMPSKPMPTRMKVPGSGTLDEDQRPGLAFTSATPINASELHETLIELSWGEPTGSRTVSSEVQTPGPKGWPLPSAISQKEMFPPESVATSNLPPSEAPSVIVTDPSVKLKAVGVIASKGKLVASGEARVNEPEILHTGGQTSRPENTVKGLPV
jgi:hypothetical protein